MSGVIQAGAFARGGDSLKPLGVLLCPAFWLLLWFCGFVSCSTYAASEPQSAHHDFVIDVWETTEGLPQNSVSSIYQTGDGYLWLGTFNGLVRFDGFRFTIFDTANCPELRSSRVTSLLDDQEGGLWIICEEGDVTRWRDGRFSQFNPLDQGKPLRIANLLNNLPTLRVSTFDGRIYEPQGETARFQWDLTTLGYGRVLNTIQDTDGTNWIACKRAFGFLDGPDTFTSLIINDDLRVPPIDRLGLSLEGGIWAASRTNGLLRFRHGESADQTIPWPSAPLNCREIFEDRSTNLWIGTVNQGLFYRSSAGVWTHFNSTNGLSSDAIRAIYQDREGNVWIGTDGGGLNRFKPRRFNFIKPLTASPRAVQFSVAEDTSGALWYGLNGFGVVRDRNGTKEQMLFPPFLTPLNAVWTLYPGRDGSVWMEDQFGGLIRHHHNQWVHYTNNFAVRRYYTRALFEDREGQVWMGDLGGLTRFSNGAFIPMEGLLSKMPIDVRAITQTPDGIIYVGCNGSGLFAYHQDKWSSYTVANGLPSDRVWSLHSGVDGTLWIGTFGGGLAALRDGKLQRLDRPGTPPIKVVSSILEDGAGGLWLGTIRGIFRMEIKQVYQYLDGAIDRLNYVTFDQSDGLETVECSGGLQPSAWRSRDGTLSFATVRGTASIHPASLRLNTEPPPLAIEQIVMHRTTERGPTKSVQVPALQPGQVTILPGMENLEIHYTALSLTAASKTRFRYKLEGLDYTWTDAENRRVAYYPFLPPGGYTFRLAAANNDGTWNEQGTMLALTVLPYFYQTWWFKTLVATLTIGGVFAIFYFRLKTMEGQRNAQRQLSRLIIESQEVERKRLAAEMHDGLGQELLIIKNRALMGLAAHDPALAEHYQAISLSASGAIKQVREISYNLRPYQLDELGLTAATEGMVSKLSGASAVKFWLNLHPMDDLFSPSDESHLFRTIQELLHNVVKHSLATEAHITIQNKGETLEVEIRDNGCGFNTRTAPAVRVDGGLGLKSVTERVAILEGKIRLQSEFGHGTKVSISIPIGIRRRSVAMVNSSRNLEPGD